MIKTKPCETCEFRGYSHEFCKAHISAVLKTAHDDCPHRPLNEVGKTAVLGAVVGMVAASTFGLVVAPAFALEVLCGHAATAACIGATAAGGGVAGAGFNVFRKVRNKETGNKRKTGRRLHKPIVI